MGYMTNGLTFAALRIANRHRLPLFKNKKGEVVHNHDGSDWSLNDWYTALSGEVGELGNLLKKVRRGDFSLDLMKDDIADELADVAIYLDILAYRLGINLGDAIMNKFNEVSRRVGVPTRLGADDYYLARDDNVL